MCKFDTLPELLDAFVQAKGCQAPPCGEDRWLFAMIAVLHYGRSTRGMRKKLPAGLRAQLASLLDVHSPSVHSYHVGVLGHEYKNITRVRTDIDRFYHQTITHLKQFA